MYRIYLCAAAADMDAERQLLQSYVLPELNDRLAEHSVEVTLDDPRGEATFAILPADEKIEQALGRIDQADGLVVFLGDVVDDAAASPSAEALAERPWLADQPDASPLELELLHGALQGRAERPCFVYLRDEQFLRDVPAELRERFSSADPATVERLEALKQRLRDAGVVALEGYPCRWDDGTGRVDDLEELGKQIVEDLYQSVLQTVKPGVEIGATQEGPAAGAAAAMLGSAEKPPAGDHASGDEDDELDFAAEEVLDVDGAAAADSTSAFDGVEPLEFLDDDEASPPPDTSPDATTELTPEPEEQQPGDDDVIDLEDVDVVDVAELTDEPAQSPERPQEIKPTDETLASDESELSLEPMEALDDEAAEQSPAADAGDDEIMDLDAGAMLDDDEPLAEMSDLSDMLEEPAAAGDEEVEEFVAEPTADEAVEKTEALSAGEIEEMSADVDAAGQGEDEDVAELFADEPDEAPAPSEMEPTMDLSKADAQDAQSLDFDDIEDSTGEGEEEDMFAGLDISEPTVRHTSERTEVTEPMEAAEDFGEQTAAEDAAEEDAEGVPAIDTSGFAGGADAAAESPTPVVQSLAAAGKPKRKKSALPMVLAALALLLVIGGGGVGGLYMAGMLPGFGGDEPVAAADNGEDAGQQGDSGGTSGLELGKKITENVTTLRNLYNEARRGAEGIDGTKIDQAQQLLGKLAANQPEVAADDQIQDMKSRFDDLARDYQRQVAQQEEDQRRQQFRQALDLAGVDAPRSLDQGFLDQARQLAKTDAERRLIAALENDVAQYESEQQQAAKEKANALALVAASAGDTQGYGTAIEAYAAAYPEDPLSGQLPKALGRELPKLETVSAFNALLDAWSGQDMRRHPPEQAAQLVTAAEMLLAKAGQLPGSTAVNERLEALRAMAARQQDGKPLVESLTPLLDNPAAKAGLVLATKDGRRYFLAERPGKQGDNLLCKYVQDLNGTKGEVEIAPGNVDRDATGPSAAAAAAQAVQQNLDAIATSGWEPAFIKALLALQADAKLDPVIKATWLVALMEVGSQGSRPLAAGLGEARQLADTAGVDASFNWADPQAAADVRTECRDALEKMPEIRTLVGDVVAKYNALQSLDAPQRIAAAGVLMQGDAGAWTARLREAAPPSGELLLLAQGAPDGPLQTQPIGTIEGGTATLADTQGSDDWLPGQIVYTIVAAE